MFHHLFCTYPKCTNFRYIFTDFVFFFKLIFILKRCFHQIRSVLYATGAGLIPLNSRSGGRHIFSTCLFLLFFFFVALRFNCGLMYRRCGGSEKGAMYTNIYILFNIKKGNNNNNQ